VEIGERHEAFAATQGLKDAYSDDERKGVLASLWDNPSSTDLKPLEDEEIQKRLWRLSSHDTLISAFLRFDRLYLYTLLQMQHEIIQLEEQTSRGEIVETDRLSTLLMQYGLSLVPNTPATNLTSHSFSFEVIY
jgi:hypothetical protein